MRQASSIVVDSHSSASRHEVVKMSSGVRPMDDRFMPPDGDKIRRLPQARF